LASVGARARDSGVSCASGGAGVPGASAAVITPDMRTNAAMLVPIFNVIDGLLWGYSLIILIGAVLSWLVMFGVVNRHNQVVYVIGDFCHRLTEPVLAPIRRVVPVMSGIDLAPMALLIAIYLIRQYLPYLLLL